MRRASLFLALALAMPLSTAAQVGNPPDQPSTIVPPGTAPGIYTTRPDQQLPSTAPLWQRPAVAAPAPNAARPVYPPLPAQLPFARESGPAAYSPPPGPHATASAPVPGVESGEVGEAAAPPPVAPADAVNPAAQNPAVPDIQTSPIFPSDASGPQPRKVVFRALNKVTGRSQLLDAKPGETVSFDRLDIQAITCAASIPSSPTDYAGLFDLKEHIPGQAQTKALFHGWMYASSPSIASLEHPIYDVTMVKCEMPEPPAPTPEKKATKKK
ncbi:MAG: DUF2155 domain-containing protein [Alphaproteobacteria bacterium]